MCVVNKCCVKDPKFYKVENKLDKHFSDYGKKFQLFKTISVSELLIMDAVFSNKSDGINNLRVTNYLMKKLIVIENVGIDSLI